jgi:hypothetical protein
MLINLKLSEVSLDPVKMPTGVYNAEITKVEYKDDADLTAGQPSNPYFVVSFKQVDPLPGTESARAQERFYLDPGSKWKVKRLCKAAGLDQNLDELATEDLVGCRVQVKVASRTYQNKAGEMVETVGLTIVS